MKKVFITISILIAEQLFAGNRITIVNETENFDLYGYVHTNSSSCDFERERFFEIPSGGSYSFLGRANYTIPFTHNGITYNTNTDLNNAFLTGEFLFTQIDFKFSTYIGYGDGSFGDSIRIPTPNNTCNVNLPNSWSNEYILETNFEIGETIYFIATEF
jgi:hypothetical protein